jgi:hypothetical protein
MSTTLASPIARPSVGRTFIVASTVLGVLALAELGAVGWVFVKRFHALTERAKLGPQKGLAGDESGVRPGDLASTATNDALDLRDTLGEGTASLEPIAPPQKPVPISASKLNTPQAPPETRFQELVLQARQLRDRGDTGAALIRLREAQTLEPQNPEAIAETAITYEKMTLLDRAGEQWRRVYEMGSAAGAFYLAAESRMKMSQAQALAAVQMAQQAAGGKDGKFSSVRADAVLGIGEVSRVDRPESGGTRFTLRVPIKARPDGERISVADVDIQVFFYDQVNGDSIVQTDADLSYRFASSPIDWSGSDPETLEVEYMRQPPLPATRNKPEKAEQRNFHGYIVRVYLRGELQDARAEPANLAEKFPAPKTLDTKTK